MRLTVLSVAYPFTPVTADPVGGAEQVLARLDRAVVAAGGRSFVIANEASAPAGELLPIASPAGEIDAAAWSAAHAQVRAHIAWAIERLQPEVIHLHGLDFHRYLPERGPPVMVTLHLPLAWYPAEALRPAREEVWLVPVSRDQARRGPRDLRLARPIENGVEVDAFPPGRKRGFALSLGRICPEKGFHLALDAARAAGTPLLLAGEVFPFREHRRYFESEIRPRLDRYRRWVGPVTGAPKRRLIGAARCLVAPSLAPETSSLVAREALAAGTPVVSLASAGAIAEVIEPGETGELAETPEALPEAIRRARDLRPEACRRAARTRFAARRMIQAYLDAYQRLADGCSLPRLSPGGCE